MKAILVIDIDDSLIEGEDKFAIDGYLMQESDCAGCYEAVGRIKNVVLKPLPEVNTWDVTENGHVTEFAEGWNACLDEILGETE